MVNSVTFIHTITRYHNMQRRWGKENLHTIRWLHSLTVCRIERMALAQARRLLRCSPEILDMNPARMWIDRLQLTRHPEGGWFRETYRSMDHLAPSALAARFDSERSLATSIYYLLEAPDFSSLHRIRSDELWYFHAGSTLLLHLIDPAGTYQLRRIGLDEQAEPQALAPAGWLFGASLAEPAGWCLVSCLVAPGFDFRDFELPTRATLLQQFPSHARLIEGLTRL